MAASSSNYRNSNPTPPWKYHVFLSFRGEDTRLNFTDHLYTALSRRGIITFRDDEELERGEVIKHELLQAIEQSLCSVVVLSRNYASSGWCLDELQKILECRKALDRVVLPIFYGVDPSDVRHQRRSFAEAFREHEERFGEDRTKIQGWRDALSEIANLSGYDSKNQQEAKFIEEIITVLCTKLKLDLRSYFDDGLVGIDAKLEDMYHILEIGSTKVRFVGIWGMGGVGKTTLAEVVFNKFRGHFDISCCLENVREESTKVGGLLGLQQKLLSSLEIKNLKIDNLNQGKAMIRNLLYQRKVLLLLDDLHNIRQLEHLAGSQDWFGKGSRIIVTTRDEYLLQPEVIFKKYRIEFLNDHESLELFCQNAFKRNRPKKGYEALSQIFVQYSKGLPLALKVLGSNLYRRDVSIWEDAFKKIKEDPPKDILDTLRISFEGLEKNEQTIFLDIACFFKGWHIDRVMQILERCGFYPKIGIQILVEKSLLTCHDRTFEMHDLLQEMGRKIVTQESGNEISKQSRLWSAKDVDEIMRENMGTKFIEGIVLSMRDYKTCWGCEAFSKMCKLRVLIIFHGLHLQLPDGLKCLSNSLKVLEWSECLLQSLPLGVKLENLVELKLQRSKIKQLWNGSQKFENLKLIDLSYSKDLICTPIFSGVFNLESLILEGCSNLVEIHQSVGQFKKLVVLNLKDCINLKCLPSKMETTCLEYLNLCGCSKVQKLHEFIENIKGKKSIETLDLSETDISEVPSSICEFRKLKYLSVRGCTGPISKPWWKFWGRSSSMGLKLPALSGCSMLRELDASYCNLNDESIPDLSCLSSLKVLRLSGNNFSGKSILMKLKSSQFPGLSKLQQLELNNCSLNDESIPNDLSCLSSLIVLDLSGNNFVSLPPGCISNLTRLWYLRITDCRNLQSLPMFPPSLLDLRLSGNNFVSLPPDCISNLARLQYLGITDCRKLQSLPMFPPSIREVHAENCGPMEVLSETQIWKLLMAIEVRASLGFSVCMSGDEIPAWLENPKDCPSDRISDRYQDSITGDIPDCCNSSRWWGILFCVIVEPPNNAYMADLLKQAFLSYRLQFNNHGYTWPLHRQSRYDETFNRNHQFIYFLHSHHFSGLSKRDGPNGLQFQLEFGASCYATGYGLHPHKQNKVNISKCGWRVVCSDEVLQKARMSELGNVPSSNFNQSTPLAIKDDPNAEHNQIQRRRT